MPDLDRARRWLNRHRLGDVEPTVAIITVGLLAWSFVVRWGRSRSDEADARDLAWLTSLYSALIVGMVVGFWWQRRAERPLLPAMTMRTAHPAATGAVRVLGRLRLAAAVAVNAGGLAVGALVALLAPTERERAIGLAVLVGVAVLATLSALTLATVLRRSSLAEDSGSLAVDDRLRLEDAKRALVPYALMCGLTAGLDSSSWVAWPLLGYTVAGAACWVLGERCRPRVAVAL